MIGAWACDCCGRHVDVERVALDWSGVGGPALRVALCGDCRADLHAIIGVLTVEDLVGWATGSGPAIDDIRDRLPPDPA